jgi:alginate O-acetyltransferase complex protein AlgI
MLFNSYQFLFVYFPVVLAGFFWISRQSKILSALWLGVASLVFYGYWNPSFVLLLLASIAFNYAAGYMISRYRLRSSRQSRLILIFAVVANLALLAYFKYANFFIQAAGSVIGESLTPLDIVLPLGISFFSFTQIAFLVDAHRGVAKEYNFIHYLLFVSYFPHLIAGPVLHHKQIMPQFTHAGTYRISADWIAAGMMIFTIGLAKKLLLADSLATGASPLFRFAESGGIPTLIEAWSGTLCYALQLYFDFSGYSDMAIGLSLCFGIALPVNFASPYKAKSIIEFWQRWHITLSQFLKEYLYIPLGGNRAGVGRWYLNIFLTMLLGGIWHGAGWTFIAWGATHGVLIVLNHFWRAWPQRPSIPAALCWLLTFASVTCAWILFRASNLDAALNIYSGLFGLNGVSLPGFLAGKFNYYLSSIVVTDTLRFDGIGTASMWVTTLVLPIALFIALALPNTQEITAYAQSSAPRSESGWSPSRACAIFTGILFTVCVLRLNDISEFLYFQF